MDKKTITEEMKIHERWFEEARKQTVDTLPEFVRHLVENYQHDYGTICHAITAAGLAGKYAVENSPTGGITGFQAGCCMWGIVRQWSYKNNKCGLRILDFDKLLYPQYENMFKSISISKDSLEMVRKEAAARIAEHNKSVKDWRTVHCKWVEDLEKFKADVTEWQKQHPEYPTYEDNPDFYKHLSCGTGREWEEERKKEESGFMFEPMEPCEPSIHPDVMAHWQSIVNGWIPFGLQIDD